MVQNLEGMDFAVVPFGQGFKDISLSTKELIKLVLEECIVHGGYSVLRWMRDNICIRTDPGDSIKPDKKLLMILVATSKPYMSSIKILSLFVELMPLPMTDGSTIIHSDCNLRDSTTYSVHI